MKQSIIDKKVDVKEAKELRKIDNHYLDKRKDKTKTTQFNVEDIFGDITFKDTFSPEKITKLNNFLAKMI